MAWWDEETVQVRCLYVMRRIFSNLEQVLYPAEQEIFNECFTADVS